MTLAQSRLADIARWLAASSKSRITPLGGATDVGRYAVIVPCDFAEPPQADFDLAGGALPLFVSVAQAAGAKTGPIVADAPRSQDRALQRIAHICWKIGTDLPRAAVVGLDDPDEPITDAIDRAGAAGVNVGSYPVLCVPTWQFTAKERAALRLPVLPMS